MDAVFQKLENQEEPPSECTAEISYGEQNGKKKKDWVANAWPREDSFWFSKGRRDGM
jgi:hypothetical protein